jgi:hypothetical protein
MHRRVIVRSLGVVRVRLVHPADRVAPCVSDMVVRGTSGRGTSGPGHLRPGHLSRA